jgi:hypothetical protein
LSRAQLAVAPRLEVPHAEVDEAALDQLLNAIQIAAGPARGGW